MGRFYCQRGGHRGLPIRKQYQKEAEMIQFNEVQGEVLISDVDKGYNQMAEKGTELSEQGNYLIASDLTSSAEISIGGRSFPLAPKCFLRVRGNRTWLDRYSESWSPYAKLFLGRIWSCIARDPRDPGGRNATVGVRG